MAQLTLIASTTATGKLMEITLQDFKATVISVGVGHSSSFEILLMNNFQSQKSITKDVIPSGYQPVPMDMTVGLSSTLPFQLVTTNSVHHIREIVGGYFPSTVCLNFFKNYL